MVNKSLCAYGQIRTCPSIDVLLYEELTPQLQEHIGKCPFCAKICNIFGDGMRIKIRGNTPKKRKEVIAVQKRKEVFEGQIWELIPSLGGWTANALHYNPPFVLVLSSFNGVVTVAQTYGDTSLLCPGEIPLGDTISGFVEPWNVYTLHHSALKTQLYTIERDIVSKVLMMMRHKFRDDLNEHQKEFRQLETDIGHVIAAQSQETLIKELVEGRDTLPYTHIFGAELHEHHYAKDIGSRMDLVLGNEEIHIYRPVAKEELESVRSMFQQIVEVYNT